MNLIHSLSKRDFALIAFITFELPINCCYAEEADAERLEMRDFYWIVGVFQIKLCRIYASHYDGKMSHEHSE